MSSNKRYIMKKCEGFTRTQNISILQFLITMNVKICEASDGSRVNLDKLSKKQIANLKRKVKELNHPIESRHLIE